MVKNLDGANLLGEIYMWFSSDLYNAAKIN